MKIVEMILRTEVLEQVLDLGERRIVNAGFDFQRSAVVLVLADAESPDDAQWIEPRYESGDSPALKMARAEYR